MTELSSYIASLEDMSIPELKKIWKQYFKTSPEQNTKSFLVRRIAYRVQELKYGGLSPNIVRLLNQEMKQININPVSTKKLKKGMLLTRNYKGIEFRVQVVENGFEFNGKVYNSLTKIALVITGSKTSGPLFFGLKG